MLAHWRSLGIGVSAKPHQTDHFRQHEWLPAALAAVLMLACSASDGASSRPPPEGSGGGGAGGAAGSTGGGSGIGGSGGSSGSPDGGTGGSAATGGSSGTGGSGGSGGNVDDGGVDPSKIVLSVVPANTTIGLEWPRVAGATGYRLYWSNAAGVTPQNGTAIDGVDRGYIHRGLTNGAAYYYVVSAITGAGEGPPSNEASGTPTGEWVLEQLGTGDFDDVKTGSRVATVPIDKRVHIVLLPEGYMAADLTIFHDDASHGGDRADDVDRWIDEVFAIEPYPLLKEAFVIWYLPRASAAHSGEGSTAFGVTVSGGSVGDVSAAAAPLWSALDNQGSDAFLFPPPSSSVNYVSAFLMFDAARGRAGVSGLTTFGLTNPSNSSQRIPASFGIGHAHEFTHGFSSLGDEYLEDNNTARAPSDTSNVSDVNTCSSLPWAHLLAGNGINTTAGLVGAYGRPVRGYHSELHCLLNGTHDNGEYYCPANSDGSFQSLTLRVNDRMCNFCREITAYRVFYRTGLLPTFDTWKTDYRTPFYQRFGFKVPSPVPQTLTCPGGSAQPTVEDCAP